MQFTAKRELAKSSVKSAPKLLSSGSGLTPLADTSTDFDSPFLSPSFAFRDDSSFQAAMRSGGCAALELCSRDLRGCVIALRSSCDCGTRSTWFCAALPPHPLTRAPLLTNSPHCPCACSYGVFTSRSLSAEGATFALLPVPSDPVLIGMWRQASEVRRWGEGVRGGTSLTPLLSGTSEWGGALTLLHPLPPPLHSTPLCSSLSQPRSCSPLPAPSTTRAKLTRP